jgi:hypothetical protein
MTSFPKPIRSTESNSVILYDPTLPHVSLRSYLERVTDELCRQALKVAAFENKHLLPSEQKWKEMSVVKIAPNPIHLDVKIDFSFDDPSIEVSAPFFLKSSQFCFDSPILVPKKKSGPLHTRALFSLHQAIHQDGDLIRFRKTENNLDIYIFDKKSYLVWSNGPQKGHIYRVLKKSKTRTFQPISQDNFKKYLDAWIQNPSSKDCEKYLETCALDLFERKHGDYHLWEAQYFSFPGQDESIIDLFTEIQNLRFRHWMSKYGVNYSGMLKLRPEVYEELVPHAKMPKIFLTHGTYSDKLPSIIQLGGIASSLHAATLGIHKTRGGEIGGSGSCSSRSVSFWEYPLGNAAVCPGFGMREGFEYPITLAVGESHYLDHNSYHSLGLAKGSKGPLRGEMRGEAMVKLFWPIECIDYIFVPSFAVEDTSKLLEEHGFTHIEVLPFTRAP